ncbi:lamin tail domain-containing protein [Corynebacterium glutamicum]|uniref:lamin tail domain-containing protein n=1 Tax=Corynebacterium glutamicum TaxID=1718 RepID=UPI000943417E|nr:lamin tail domain-containing protein [Corynebacterium glutamicum]OKX85281.1 hypothetical protein AUO96_12425 [Corynebacterium glutamicum]QDX76195.1 hypothetical protein AKL15_10795 [Corynebacterium glutamicum]QDX78969.1 hypothetical protein AKL16_10800 [Corynebacterium glutamicum]TWS31536.1 hypothetical protein AKJ19_11120 [Corynebacterium glutamicum]TWS39220.1 hypothetical protein AKJ24_11120 [Corynebacterium glutamicum]
MVEVKKRNLLVAPLTASLVFCNLAVAANAVEVEAESPVVINEVESNSDPVGDWVELANTDNNNSIDISGWSLVDDKEDLENALVLPEGTEIESGGYFVIYTDSADYVPTNNTFGGQEYFGLGKDDTVTLRNAEGEVVATYSWKDLGEHAENTYGRIPDMTGDFANTGVPTPGAKNVAAEGSGEEEGVVANAQLPFHNVEITPIHLGGDFTGEDMSGVDFDANGTAWIANNDIGKIYSLSHDIANNTYKLTGEWETGYPEGGGEPDAEGIVAATNGDIYLSTERNNADKNVSRPSILRFATPTGKTGVQNAVQEWNLSEFVGDIQPNGGLEAIAQLEDNIFVVGVEETGDVIVVDLSADEPVLVQRYESSFDGVMSLDYNAATKQLSVVCDEACDGLSEILEWDGEKLYKSDDKIYERPANLGNWANEGFGTYTSELKCENGNTVSVTSYLWADDAATNEGTSLNSAQVINGDCGDVNIPGESSSDNSSSDFATGSIAGAFATAVLAVVGIAGALGGFFQQILAAFPALQQVIRF